MTRSRTAAAGLACALLGVLLAPLPAAAGTAAQTTWHADQARIPEARAAGRGGAGVVVAVLDSWVDGRHKDFDGRVQAGADCIGGTCRPGPAAQDACQHGTHVAGTVASSSYGVAPSATVLPVRVLSYDAAAKTCVGRPEDVAAGVRWAVGRGARVLNLSLGPDDAPLLPGGSSLPQAIAEAARAGVVVVFSAGNTERASGQRYGDQALVVAATGPDGELASYSQPGDLAAPGGDPVAEDACTRADCVTSLFPRDGYSVAAGTSMAAPHVAGVAALLLAQDPRRSRDDVRNRLLSTTRGSARLLDARAALGVPPPGTSSQADTAPQPVEPRSPAPAAVPGAPAPGGPPPGQPAPPAPGGPPPLPGAPDATALPDGGVAPAPTLAGTLVTQPAGPAPQPVPPALIALATALLAAAGAATFAGSRR